MQGKQEQFKKMMGARIRALRIKKGYSSLDTFAFTKNIDRSQYGKYERGMSDMRLSSFIIVLSALEISVEEFFSEGFEKLEESAL